MDFVIYCTGSTTNFSSLLFLEPLRKRYNLSQSTEAGFPKLAEELVTSADIPLYVTGRLASLQLGPGAGNLEGAREGAERVAWGIEEHLGRKRHDMRHRDRNLDLEFQSHNAFELLGQGSE